MTAAPKEAASRARRRALCVAGEFGDRSRDRAPSTVMLTVSAVIAYPNLLGTSPLRRCRVIVETFIE